MKECLAVLIKRYPLMEASDYLKLCYQATFGAEHLLTDIKEARSYFDQEFDEAPIKNEVVVDVISDDIVRINFGGFKRIGDKEALWQAFLTTATTKRGSDALFIKNIKEILAFLKETLDNTTYQTIKKGVDEYIKGGIRPLHHSEQYRTHYQPHYRVVDQKWVDELLKKR